MIPNPPVKVNLSSGSDSYMGVAEQQFKILESIRLSTNLPILKKTFSFGGSIVAHLISSDYGSKIILMGSAGQIMLASKGMFNIYDYLTDNYRYAVGNDKFIPAGDLSPTFNDSCQIDSLYINNSGTWKTSDIETGYDYLGGVPAYEMVIYNKEQKLYGFIEGKFNHITTLPSSMQIVPTMSGQDDLLFGVASIYTHPLWNIFSSTDRFQLTPNNGNLNYNGQWIPSLFVVEPADPYGLKHGWYYGKYPNAEYDSDNALTTLEVSLMGFLDVRFKGDNTAGWCEIVTSVNGNSKFDLYFYLDNLKAEIATTSYYERVAGTTADASLTIGTAIDGFDHRYLLQLDGKPDEIKWWNLNCWYDPDTSIPQEIGCQAAFIVTGKKLIGYKFHQYAEQFIDVDNYIDYAISENGQLAAVFCGVTVIETVYVFDLFGERTSPKVEKYSKGGFTNIRTSNIISTLLASTGCFVEQRKEKIKIIEFPITPSIAEQQQHLFADSLSTLNFKIDGNGGLAIHKVICSNGVDAKYSYNFNECFGTSTIIVDDINITSDEDKLISKWDAGGIFQGKVRGEFSSDGTIFNGIGNGDSGRYGTISFPPTFSMSMYTNKSGFSYGAYSGDLIEGDCITSDGKPDPDCYEALPCDGIITFTATSSCGQTAETYETIVSEELTITGVGDNELLQVGDYASASGGHKPYTFSMTGGSIDSSTGEILSFDGCPTASGSITVVDNCGESDSATAAYDIPSATWVNKGWVTGTFNKDTSTWEDDCADDAPLYCCDYTGTTVMVTEIQGNIKYEERWRVYGGKHCSCGHFKCCAGTADLTPLTTTPDVGADPNCGEYIYWIDQRERWYWEC